LKDLVSNFNVSNRKIDTNLDYYYNSVNSAGNYLKPKPTDEAFRVWACETKSGNPYCCGGGQLAGFYDVFGYGNPLLYKLYLFRNKGRNFNNLLNVKYYVSDLCSNFRIRTSDKLIESDILPVGYPSPMDQKKWSPLFIYENLNRYGPGWVVDSISYLDNKMYQDEILTKISDTKVDLKKVAFLVKNDLQEKDLQTINKINTSNDSLVYDIKLMEYNNNSIKLNVNSSKNALLVLSELYYPGWKVYVNGISEETLETDNLLRGVLIQKGSNFVEFKFRPTSFILGSIISILTFLLAISFLFINFKGYHYSRINIIIIALQFALIINFALGYLQVSSYKMNVKDKNAENKNRDVYKPGTNLIFSKDGNGVQYLKTGWSSSETNYTWSSSKKATIELPFESLPQNDINLKMKFSVYLKQNVLDSQSVKIFINDQKMDEMSIKDSKIVDYVLKIPKSIFENNNTLSITFELPDAFVPAQHGIGSDNRALGLCLRNLVIETIK
jgi:SAM-dependent methyltransferase